MKIVKNDEICFQGDVMIQAVCEIPKDAKAVEGGIVAHSETGHHHVAERAKVYAAPDGMTLFMQAVGKSIDVVHHRPWDTHETIRLLGDQPGQIWKVKRQREYVPEGWRRVED